MSIFEPPELVAPERRMRCDGSRSGSRSRSLTRCAALIDPADPVDPIAAHSCPTAPNSNDSPDDRPDPSAMTLFAVARHRPPLPGPGIAEADLVCPVYCTLLLPLATSRPGNAAGLDALGPRPRLYPGRPRNLGGHRHRRDPFRCAAPARRDRARPRRDPHVAVIRFHTRVPVVDPGRVGSRELVGALGAERRCMSSSMRIIRAS